MKMCCVARWPRPLQWRRRVWHPHRSRRGRAPVRIGHNRREMRAGRIVLGHHPKGPEAPWVDVLRVDAADGTPLAVVFATAAHPVNLNALSISAEFPGYAAQFVRDNLAMPLFLQGCCGDINCSPKDGTFEGSALLGTRLGAATLTAALHAERLESDVLAGEQSGRRIAADAAEGR